MTRPIHRLPFAVEPLEDRCTPAVWGNAWADPGGLTLSFAPDGTSVDGAPSQLFQELNGTMSSAEWQREVLRAFQTWAAAANINLCVVGDNGKPFGEAGPIQGSSWYGDIRIGAMPMSPNTLAVSTPFDLFGGWSGDVLLNTAHNFNVGGTGGAYDLYTVMLQEAGHVLGLGNSADVNSVMYTQYRGPRTGLDASDVAALQAIYGIREADRFELLGGNETRDRASSLLFVTDANQLGGTDGTGGIAPYVAAGDLTTLSDIDVYRFTVPSCQSDFSVRLRTEGLSLLTAKVTVTDANGKVLATTTATDPSDSDLLLFVKGARAGATYYVQVQGADQSVFSIGAYRLAVGPAADAAVMGAAGYVNDNHKNDTLNQATQLGMAKDVTDERWDFTYRGSISDKRDADWYRIETKDGSSGTLLVTVWAAEVGQLDPVVSVYDDKGQLVAAEVVANDAGFYAIQIRGVTQKEKYYVKVAAADPLSLSNVGNYFLGIDFRVAAINLDQFAAGTLTDAQMQAETTLTTHETQLYLLTLRATTTNPVVKSGVRMTIFDAAFNEVFSLFAGAGQTVSGNVMLGAGTYHVRFSGGAEDPSQTLPDLSFLLSGMGRSDPIGPEAEDTADLPIGTTDSKPPATWTPLSWFDGSYTSPFTPL